MQLKINESPSAEWKIMLLLVVDCERTLNHHHGGDPEGFCELAKYILEPSKPRVGVNCALHPYYTDQHEHRSAQIIRSTILAAS